jgi:hypothetical protein
MQALSTLPGTPGSARCLLPPPHHHLQTPHDLPPPQKHTHPAGVLDRQTSVLNFCANNYLGLSNHPDVVAAAKKALDTHGFGLSSVRFICGTQVHACTTWWCTWWCTYVKTPLRISTCMSFACLPSCVSANPACTGSHAVSTPRPLRRRAHLLTCCCVHQPAPPSYFVPPSLFPTLCPLHPTPAHPGPAQAARGAHQHLPWHAGHHPVPQLL